MTWVVLTLLSCWVRAVPPSSVSPTWAAPVCMVLWMSSVPSFTQHEVSLSRVSPLMAPDVPSHFPHVPSQVLSRFLVFLPMFPHVPPCSFSCSLMFLLRFHHVFFSVASFHVPSAKLCTLECPLPTCISSCVPSCAFYQALSPHVFPHVPSAKLCPLECPPTPCFLHVPSNKLCPLMCPLMCPLSSSVPPCALNQLVSLQMASSKLCPLMCPSPSCTTFDWLKDCLHD